MNQELTLEFHCQLEKWDQKSGSYRPAESRLNHPLTTGQQIRFSGLIIALDNDKFTLSYAKNAVPGIAINDFRSDNWAKEVTGELLTGKNVLCGQDIAFTLTEITPEADNALTALTITKPVQPNKPHPDRLVISRPTFIKEGSPGKLLL